MLNRCLFFRNIPKGDLKCSGKPPALAKQPACQNTAPLKSAGGQTGFVGTPAIVAIRSSCNKSRMSLPPLIQETAINGKSKPNELPRGKPRGVRLSGGQPPAEEIKSPLSFLLTVFFGTALTACNGLLENSPDSKTLSEWKRDTRELVREALLTVEAEKTQHAAAGADYSACDKALHKANQAQVESESTTTRENAKTANDKAKEALKQAKGCGKNAGEEATAKRIAQQAGRIAEQARAIAGEVKNEADTKKRHYEDLKTQAGQAERSFADTNIKTIDKALKTVKEVETEAGKIKTEAESADTESQAEALLKRAKTARQKIEDIWISLLRF